MRMKLILLAGAAALALGACGKKEATGTPAAPTADATGASPLARPYHLDGAKAVDVDALVALLGDKVKVAYDNASFDQKLGATVVTNLRIEDKPIDETIKAKGVSIDRAELYGVDMDAINKVKTGTSTPDAVLEKVFDQVRLFGVKPDAEEGEHATTSIGAVEIDALRVRDGGIPEKEGESGNAARVFNAFDVAGLFFKDLSVKTEESDRNPAGANSFTAPDLRFVGVGGGKLAAIVANDVEYSIARSAAARAQMAQNMGPAGALLTGPLAGLVAPDNARFAMKSFTWKGIDFSGLLAYGLKGEKPPVTAKELIDLGTIQMADANTYISGRKACHTDQTNVTAMQFSWLVPSKIHAESKGGECDYTAYVDPSDDKTIAVLKSHGLDDVKGDSNLDWAWDTVKGDAGLGVNFNSKALADFSLALNLAGMDLAKIKAAEDAGDKDAVMKVGSFKGFDLKLAEHNLLDAIYELAALQQGGAAADIRQSIPAMVRLSGAQITSQIPQAKEYVDAIADFLGEGGTIEISALPKQPVPFEKIKETGAAGPKGVPDLLNLKVTHTK